MTALWWQIERRGGPLDAQNFQPIKMLEQKCSIKFSLNFLQDLAGPGR